MSCSKKIVEMEEFMWKMEDKCSPQTFDYSNCLRNMAFEEVGFVQKPKLTKTGTTIVATVYEVCIFGNGKQKAFTSKYVPLTIFP